MPQPIYSFYFLKFFLSTTTSYTKVRRKKIVDTGYFVFLSRKQKLLVFELVKIMWLNVGMVVWKENKH